jgi:hypothetical protein
VADVDAEIDRLYQLPLDQFTAARNAMSKELKRPTIKDLEKPNVAAWAVNQLYWKERAAYDRLLKSGERLRAEHRKMLSGKSSDIREAEQLHRDAIKEAAEKIRTILQEAGQALSPATLTAVQETLEALPATEPPGRLTRPLKPLGFEALSGVTIKPTLRIVPKAQPLKGSKSPGFKGSEVREDDGAAPQLTRADEQRLAKQRAREERERKERQREAERELKAAEAAMLRAEEAVKKAEQALADLRAKRDEAVSEYQRARLRAHE